MKNQKPAWLDQKEYPFESKFIDQNGISQHYIDEGKGEPILFVHGTPSWSFDFRYLIKAFVPTHQCIALDHIGFGLSEKPLDYKYTLANHTKNLTRLIEHLNLKNITLVVHDFGGPIGLEYALQNPHNIKRLVIMNSWIGSSENEPEYQKMKRILKSRLLPFLYLRLNFSPRHLLPSSFGKDKPSRKIKKHFTKPFPDKKSRYGMLSFARILLNDQAFFETQLNRIKVLESIPCLLIWGAMDKFVGLPYLKRFQGALPKAQSHALSDTGHFPQEESPNEVISRMQQFIRHEI